MSVLDTITSNWRLFVLAFLLVISGVVLFGPSGSAEPPPNLQYGIQLDGGTRLRAPLIGMTAESVQITGSPRNFEQAVANALGPDVEGIDVEVRLRAQNEGTVELFARNVTREEFAQAIRSAGGNVSTAAIRDGVTAATREEEIDVIDRKISEAGFSGASARIARTPGGEYFIVVESPNRGVEELRDLLRTRGTVRVVAYYPVDGQYRNTTVLTQDDFSDIGIARQDPQSTIGYYVPVTVKDSVADDFAQRMVDAGFENGADCNFNGYGSEQTTGSCLLIISDGRVVNAFGVEPGLGQSFANGDFVNDPSFRMTVPTQNEAQRVAIHLRAGRLPAPLDFNAGTVFSLEPALAQRFKVNSALTGVIAMFAVAGVVFVRYRETRVALPMIVTALSEVVLLLGFAAGTGLALNLSHIAGFIAVIGTGVDDLIIIADEVMAEGAVSSSRVFQSRFRKAFWIIGAAAGTTVIAMTPLATPWLALGDLRGFAIVTIVGVFIGVFITRPAYGDILRYLTTEH